MSENILRILLADDHEVVRRGLRQLLEDHEGWTVCGEAVTGREAVEMAKAAAKAAGLDPGHPREPLTRLSRGAETSIAKLI